MYYYEFFHGPALNRSTMLMSEIPFDASSFEGLYRQAEGELAGYGGETQAARVILWLEDHTSLRRVPVTTTLMGIPQG